MADQLNEKQERYIKAWDAHSDECVKMAWNLMDEDGAYDELKATVDKLKELTRRAAKNLK